MDRENYTSPLSSRYASEAMRFNWSDTKKFTTWRRLWIALAEAEQSLGLPITDEQLAELREHATDVDYDLAAEYEGKLRHDVMAHVHAWGDQCPNARGIIHLGATSCFVGDNTDLVQLRDGLDLVRRQVVTLIGQLRSFCDQWKDLPVLGYTHYQPAQATTLGKRATLWLQDLVDDLNDLEHAASMIRFRGVKGTTGTQASFLNLFDGDHAKVVELDERVSKALGFERRFAVTGQTYSRRLDFRIGQVLSGICQSAHKFATDLRLMSGRREVEEPFGKKQIGSSAMAYKRNPMRSERICSLARFVHSLATSPRETHANQWLERTLDDSANRRLVLTEAMLATDAVLNLVVDVTAGLVVNVACIDKNMADELPFMATENVLMRAVSAGGDRQALHEVIRTLSMESARQMKEQGAHNDLMDRMRNHPELGPHVDDSAMDPQQFVGRSPQQVAALCREVSTPLLERQRERAGRFVAKVKV